MSELSPRARAACAALRDASASDVERERVRARLSALGVAMTVTASAALASSAAASSAASVAGTTSASAGVSSAVLGYGNGSAVGAVSVSKTGAIALTGVGGKLLGLPVAVKASLALLALSSALAAPKLWPAPTATRTATAELTRGKVRPTLKAAREQPVQVSLARGPARFDATRAAGTDAGVLPLPMREPSGQRARSVAPFVTLARSATRKPVASVSSAEAAQESTLSAESALLESALHALRNGRRARAQELLLRHEETYGAHALLARERERMRKELSHSPR